MKKTDEGFTLIELLIVIVILGILATVVVFAVSGITNRGDQNACLTDLRTVETALEAYYAQEGGWPASQDDLVGEFLRSAPTYTAVNYATTPPTVTAGSECAGAAT